MSIAEKIQTIAENEQLVYDAGKQAEYDAFWDAFQNNGNRTSYLYAFAGEVWNSKIFNPKYPIVLNHKGEYRTSNYMFYNFDRDLTQEPLEIHEGDIDFSGDLYTMTNMFTNANISVVEMNAIPSKLTSMSGTFGETDITRPILETIKIATREETTYNSVSFMCSMLKNVSFVEGSVVGENIVFSHCRELTKDSLLNIINVLKDYSNTTTTKTLTIGSTNTAKLTMEELLIAENKGWTVI